MSQNFNYIDPSARFANHRTVSLGHNVVVEELAQIGEKVTIGNLAHVEAHAQVYNGAHISDGAVIGTEATIGYNAFIGDSAVIGKKVSVGGSALILTAAKICPNFVNSGSRNARELKSCVSVGAGVLLHDEVELGEYAIVPTQRTIAHMGHFGSKNRVVTIYGSDDGPRMSVGCQIGKTFETIFGRVEKSSCTTTESSDTYVPYLDIFEEVGRVVQRAYDQELPLVEDIKAQRRELDLPTY